MERFVKVAIVVVIVAIAAYFGYNLFSSWQIERIETAKKDERIEWEKRTKGLMEKVTGLEEELASIKGETIPQQKLKEVWRSNFKGNVTNSNLVTLNEEKDYIYNKEVSKHTKYTVGRTA